MNASQKMLADKLDTIGIGDSQIRQTVRNAINKIESNEEISKKKKKENREATATTSTGQYSPLFGEPSSKEIVNPTNEKVPVVREEDGFNPPKLTMFSDESKEYKLKTEEVLKGGLADEKEIKDLAKKHSKSSVGLHLMTQHLKKQLEKGIKVEMEHTKNKQKAKEIAMDHLLEDPDYYTKLKKMENKEGKSEKEIDEKWSQKYKDSINCSNPKGFSQRAHCQGKKKKSETKEATGAGSSGSYSQPAIWAKSTNKKDWVAARKTQIPGGKFVTVKKKCKTFPYCNQGDINAVKLWENETMKKIISNVSEKTGLNEYSIKSIIYHELKNTGKLPN